MYSEVLGVEHLRVTRPELFTDVDEAIARDARDYLKSSIPSSIAVNVVPISADGAILCAERSSAVDSAVGWWTVGVFETMKRTDPNRPGAPEDLYSLAIRGLDEELGLLPHEYGPITISWVGLYRPILRGHVVALVRLAVSRDDAIEHARQAHSGYGHAKFDWLPLRKSLVTSFIEAPHRYRANSAWKTLDTYDRTWIEQSRLAVLEAWRFRGVLPE